MLWLRKGVVFLLALLLLAVVLVGVNAVSLNKTFGTSDNLKKWLAESSIYNNVIDSVLTEAQVNSIKTGNETSIPLDNDIVKQSADAVFTTDLIQDNVNNFIDGNYSWIQGKTPTPEFSINLENAKKSFADRIGKEVETRLATLPTCTPEQLAKFQIPLDPLTITCRPGTLIPAAEGLRVTEEVNSSEFLKRAAFDANTIGKDNDNRGDPYYKQLDELPNAYKLIQKLPLFAIVAFILLSAAIIFIAPTKRRGIRKIGSTLLFAGLILIVGKLVSGIAVSEVENNVLTKTFDNQLKNGYAELLQKIQDSLMQSNFQFGIAFIILALVIFIVLVATRNRTGGGEKKDKKDAGKGKQDKKQANKTSTSSSSPLSSPNGRSLPPDFYDDDDELESLAPPTPLPQPTPLADEPEPTPAAPVLKPLSPTSLTPRPAQTDEEPLHRPPLSATTAPALKLKKRPVAEPKKRPPRFVQ